MRASSRRSHHSSSEGRCYGFGSRRHRWGNRNRNTGTCEVAAHRRALLLEREERRQHVGGREAERLRQRFGRHGAERLEAAAHELAQRRVAILDGAADDGEPLGGDRARERDVDLGQPLRGDPHGAGARQLDDGRAAVGAQALEHRRPRGAFPRRRRSRAARARRAARRRSTAAARPLRARARSRRGRACRARPPAPASCSGAIARRACAAPRPARRRGTRNGFAPRISCASGDGLVSSRQMTSTSPASMRRSTSTRPSMSIAAVRQSLSVCLTSG